MHGNVNVKETILLNKVIGQSQVETEVCVWLVI